MNGTAPDEAAERATRKRAMEAELAAIRQQKAEVLRAIAGVAKRQRTGGPPSRAVAHSAEQKLEAAKRAHRAEVQRVWSGATKILQELLKNQSTRIYFGEPVRRDLFPRYYEVIADPRDLGSAKRAAEEGRYADVYALRDDVRLCFENCRAFNAPGDAVRKIGDAASDQFEQKWAARGVEAAWEAAHRQHALAVARLEAEAKSLPDKIAEVDAELRALAAKAAERAGGLPPPGPGREMTFEEKRRLSHAVGSLPGDRLFGVLEIVEAGAGAGGGGAADADDEADLDMDALDAPTLWKLQAYCDAVLAELESKAAAAAPPAPAPGAGAPKAEGGGESAASGAA